MCPRSTRRLAVLFVLQFFCLLVRNEAALLELKITVMQEITETVAGLTRESGYSYAFGSARHTLICTHDFSEEPTMWLIVSVFPFFFFPFSGLNYSD